jgi:two-component system LytT family response regulator
MRALVVDDEVHARDSLKAMLEATGEVTVVGCCGDALQALRAVREEGPDVLFLDVQMPKVNGFQLVSMIDQAQQPHVVFVTAFDAYAVKAFDEDALDYLLKPVQQDRLARTIEKLKRALRDGQRPSFESPAIERIPCTGVDCVRLVDVADVELVRCGPAGVYVVTSRGEFLTELTMQVLEAKTDLARCHRQVLVNVRQVEEVRRPEPRAAVLRLKSGKEVPASRRYFQRLKERLGLRRDGRYVDPLS